MKTSATGAFRLRDESFAGEGLDPAFVRVAALCLTHGVRELWSADRDFSRFPGLRVVNPLID